MKTTEEQAKQLFCHQRFSHAAPRLPYSCLGSQCMAWRWDEWGNNNEDIDGKKYGYCGLVGKP